MEKPTYLLDTKILQKTFDEFSQYFSVHYPVKSNNNHDLLALLDKCGAAFEVETVGNLNDLSSVGVSPEKVLFYSPYANQEDLDQAIQYGVRNFVVTSIDSLNILESTGIKYCFLIRLREDCVSTFKKKSGATDEEIEKILSRATNGEFQGVSFYLNSEINNFDNLKKMIDYAVKVAEKSRSHEKIIDIGGGIGTYICEDISQYINALGNYHIIIEPGRDLINPAIDLVATVISVDANASVAYLNTGIYNGLLDAVVKEKKYVIQAMEARNSKVIQYLLSGPTADLSDVLGNYKFPELKVGDKLLIKACGAYSEVLSTSFYGLNNFEMHIL